MSAKTPLYHLFLNGHAIGQFSQKVLLKRFASSHLKLSEVYIQPTHTETLLPLEAILPSWKARKSSRTRLTALCLMFSLAAGGYASWGFLHPTTSGSIAGVLQQKEREASDETSYYLNDGSKEVTDQQIARVRVLNAAKSIPDQTDERFLSLMVYAEVLEEQVDFKTKEGSLPNNVAAILKGAVENGDLSMIRYAASKGLNPCTDTSSKLDNYGYPYEGSVIDHAISHRKYKLVDMLIDGLSAEEKKKVGGDLLRTSASKRDLKMTAHLLEKGLSPDDFAGHDSSNLKYARSPEIRALLKKAGAQSAVWLDLTKRLEEQKKDPKSKQTFSEQDLALVEAVERGDIDAVRQLKETGMALSKNYGHYDNTKLFQMACDEDNPAMMAYLQQNGGAPEKGKEPILYEVIRNGQLKAAQYLIEHTADMDLNATLCDVVEHSYAQPLAQWLLDHGADANAITKQGYHETTPLANAGSLGMVKLLILRGADVNRTFDDNNKNVLTTLLSSGKTKLVDYLVKCGAKTDQLKATALCEAAQKGDFKLMQYCLNQGISVNSAEGFSCGGDSSCTPLHLALVGGQNFNTTHNSSRLATKTAAWLISKGADVNARSKSGRTPLMETIINGSYNMSAVKLLLEHGADPSIRDEGGKTVVHYAKTGKILRSLFDAGIPLSPPDDKGKTLLISYVADAMEDADLYEECFKRGLDANTADKDGNTALHWCTNGSTRSNANICGPAIEALFKHDADPEKRNHAGDTPLLHALRNHPYPEAVKDLVAHGVDIHAINSDGMTGVMELVEQCKHYKKELRDFFAAKGVKKINHGELLYSGELDKNREQTLTLSKTVTTDRLALAIYSTHRDRVSYIAELELLDAQGQPIPREKWTVSASSVETQSENGEAMRMIDGDKNTFWHSCYSKNDQPPYFIRLNLGKKYTVARVTLVNRQEADADSIPKKVEVLLPKK